MACHHHIWYAKYFDQIGGGDIGLLLSALLVSIIGSFLHCVGMCGPIASAQFSLRLMGLSADKMTQSSKLKAALCPGYYLGKILSYIIIVLFMYYSAIKLKEAESAKYLLVSLLILMSCGLFYTGIRNYIKINMLENIRSKINQLVSKMIVNSKLLPKTNTKTGSNHQSNYWLSGIIFGFIPCGYLYLILGLIAVKASNIIVVLAATILFGLGTFPGLFLISYFGNMIFFSWKKIFNLFFSSIMIINCYLLFKFALRML